MLGKQHSCNNLQFTVNRLISWYFILQYSPALDAPQSPSHHTSKLNISKLNLAHVPQKKSCTSSNMADAGEWSTTHPLKSETNKSS